MSGPPLPPREQSVVVDDDLVLQAIVAEVKDAATEGKLDEGETKSYDIPTVAEVKTLRLSFKNIYQIDNLVGLASLVQLRLDNNTIKRIENIDHLVNLTWLDLSFNNIAKIEGLETLTKLTDLSLYNNAIAKVENLDALTDLHVLSLGNNKIASTEQIHYLRRFEHLEVVHMEGNPVFSEVDYKTVALAYLRHLKYLDYKLVDPAEVTHSREACQDDLMELEDSEALEAGARERDEMHQAQLAELRAANLEVSELLLKSMFREDSDLPKFKIMPGITELIEEIEDNYKAAAAAFQATGLETHVKVEREQKDFARAVQFVSVRADKRAVAVCTKYQKTAKTAFQNIHHHQYPAPEMLTPLRKENDALLATLMTQELECVEQIREITDTFEIAYGDIKSKILEGHQTFFRAVEDFENAFSEAAMAIAERWVKQAQDGNLEAVSDELAALAADRDSLFGYITGSHDAHVGKLLAMEDETRERTNKRYKGAISAARDTEHKRDRDRVAEIHHLHRQNLRAIEETLDEMFGDEDD